MPATKKKRTDTAQSMADEETSEKPGSEGPEPNMQSVMANMPPLSPLGQRTLEGYVEKYGANEGRRKFMAAMSSSRMDRSKMVKSGGK